MSTVPPAKFFVNTGIVSSRTDVYNLLRPLLKQTVAAVRRDVEAGLLFSDALERHPKVFSQLYVAMVRAGEAGGVLEDCLMRVADQLEKDAALKRQVRAAMPDAVAVFIAQQTGLQHAFWVVLGTLSVLRSNALATGASIVRALAGTAVGILVGAALVIAIGTRYLWSNLS